MPSDVNSTLHCLCLVCRRPGHIVEDCPRYIRQWESPGLSLPPNVESTRPSPPLHPVPIPVGSTQALCARCSQLDAAIAESIAHHRPIVAGDFDDNHIKRATNKMKQIPPLGPIRTLRLLATCPLCRLLFDVSYLTDDDMDIIRNGGKLFVVTGWTLHRLEATLYWKGHEKGKGPYAKCLYTAVADSSSEDGIDERLVADAVDTVVLVHNGENDGIRALGVRLVDPTTPNYGIIKDWLRWCNALHHITCRPLVSESLRQIRLVDVEAHQVIVCPAVGCDNVALSFV